MTTLDIARSLIDALQAGRSGEDLRDLFTPDATTTEHPNAITPLGATRTVDENIAGSIAGASLLSEQRYDVHDTIESGDTVVLRLTWTGTVANDVGPFTAEQVLTAHIAQFVTVRDGRIHRLETFDCYEPLR